MSQDHKAIAEIISLQRKSLYDALWKLNQIGDIILHQLTALMKIFDSGVLTLSDYLEKEYNKETPKLQQKYNMARRPFEPQQFLFDCGIDTEEYKVKVEE